MDYYGDVAPNGDDVHTAQWLELVTVRVRPKRHEVKYVTSREACFTTSGDPGRVAYYLLLVNDLLTHVIEERPRVQSVLYEYAAAHHRSALLSMAKPPTSHHHCRVIAEAPAPQASVTTPLSRPAVLPFNDDPLTGPCTTSHRSTTTTSQNPAITALKSAQAYSLLTLVGFKSDPIVLAQHQTPRKLSPYLSHQQQQ